MSEMVTMVKERQGPTLCISEGAEEQRCKTAELHFERRCVNQLSECAPRVSQTIWNYFG